MSGTDYVEFLSLRLFRVGKFGETALSTVKLNSSRILPMDGNLLMDLTKCTSVLYCPVLRDFTTRLIISQRLKLASHTFISPDVKELT